VTCLPPLTRRSPILELGRLGDTPRSSVIGIGLETVKSSITEAGRLIDALDDAKGGEGGVLVAWGSGDRACNPRWSDILFSNDLSYPAS
jgi:hypothetical protein